MLVGQLPPLVASLLEDLTPSQQRAVETPSPTVCVLAAAGAGKTRVLTRRIAFRVLSGRARAEHVLAVTFTKKAASELKQRLAELGLEKALMAGTFHSFAWQQLRRYWADRRAPEPVLLPSKGRLLAELSRGRPGLEAADVADLANAIEWAKARLVAPGALAAEVKEAGRDLPAEAEAVAGLYARYEDEKRRRRLLDFDDILSRYTEALYADSRFAAAQRWKWGHVFVDELQDMNPLQCRLLLALLGGNEDLFVVGDPNQAIYGWNGADPGFLTSFPGRFPDAEVVRLDENHRSSPQIVAAAVAVLGRQGAGELRSAGTGGPLPTLSCFGSEESEATGVTAQVLEARSAGLAWADMAVLARTNAQLRPFAEAFSRAGVPFLTAAPDAEVAGSEEAGLAPSVPAGPGAGASDAVTLCSFHRAKGLEWRCVWVTGLEAGLVPIAYATSPASLAEERRLLYVALTRAEQRLHCSWARERRAPNGVSLRRSPSPWLSALAPHCSGTAPDREGTTVPLPRGAGAEAAPFLAMARRHLTRQPTSTAGSRRRPVGPSEGPFDASSAQSVVAERLVEWRRRLARASGVPPHVLLHDSTVLALARLMPSDTEALLAVPGLGPVKAARFGPAILSVLASALNEVPSA
jgi:DNA helicase-2/ATP-dependent DNA helicase PcrA